jgi:hypothetical protein
VQAGQIGGERGTDALEAMCPQGSEDMAKGVANEKARIGAPKTFGGPEPPKVDRADRTLDQRVAKRVVTCRTSETPSL